MEHFDEIKDSSDSKIGVRCRIPECGSVLTYVTVYNMERHLIGKHEKLATEIGLISEVPRKLLKLVVQVDLQEFLKNCVAIVTVCHLPFNIYSKKCFRGLIDPIASKLPIPALTPTNISILCGSVEQIFVDLIKNEIKDNLVSLKIDLATRHGRSVIGVNLQLIIKGQLTIRTLGLIETTDRHTAKYIEKEVLHLLDKFAIKITQLCSSTTDAGSNVLKFVKLMINGQEMEFFEEENEEVNATDEIGEVDIASDEIPEDIPDELLVELDSILRSVKCVAHTLNLVVVEAASGEDTQAMIGQVRELIKILRSEPYKQSFKANKKRLPFLDCTTRWGFTYLMIDCILESQQFIIDILPANLNEKYDKLFWDNCRVIYETLKPVYIVTKKVQDHAIVYGDFFIMWQELILELQEIDNELAKKLLSAMEKREPNCFDNDAFYAAALLDRRINYNGTLFLTEDQKKSGMVCTYKINSF